jgi:hypothetical protein
VAQVAARSVEGLEMTAAAQRIVPASSMSTEALTAAAWRAGDLSWMLRDHQLPLYRRYREWEKEDPTTGIGQYRRVFVLDIGKRWGKTTFRLIVRLEDCLRNPGRHYRYVTAFDKDIGEIVGDIMPKLLDGAPASVKPSYVQSRVTKDGPQPAGYYFPNGSSLRLAGLDKHPDALRGRASDGDDVSEAAFIKRLKYVVKNVLYHQYQGRPHARMCLESSAPVDPDGDYDREFVADAQARGACWYGTIDDNTALSEAERQEFIDASGGRDHPDCQREYFNKRVRDPERVIVPEFDKTVHVRATKRPAYAMCFVAMDPGMSDRLAILWGYWDWMGQSLVIERSWAEFNAGTDVVANVLKATEEELWSGKAANDNGALLYWSDDKRKLLPNPIERWTDVDLRLAHDLKNLHGVEVLVIDNPAGSADADVQQMRNAFRSNAVCVLPDSGPLAAELEAGKRKLGGRPSDWETSPVYGHYDCLAALKYLIRKVWISRSRNPFPPEGALLNGEAVIREPWADHAQQSRSTKALNAVFGGGRVRR